MAYLLGIDQGTTQTTAVVLAETGEEVARRSVPLPATFPRPGWVEQDPWRILATVREAAGPLAATYPISAVGLDNQGETFLLWDGESGRPVTPAVVWQDKRGQAVCRELAGRVEPGWLRARTGLLLDSYFSAPKLCAILAADPALAAAARAGRLRFGTTETWVIWNLSHGRLHVTDPSTASRTLLFDINRLVWDEELLALFGVPRSLLPEVRPSAGYVGDLDLGDGRALPLQALLVDQQAALFGQACFAPGEAKCTFGTGTFLLMNTGLVPRPSEHGLLTTVAWHLDGATTYALDGGILATGSAVQWLVEGLGILPNAPASAEVAAASTDRTVTFVPALCGLAAPHWQPEACGAIFGLTRSTTGADLVRAMLEGIACRVWEVVRAMEEDGGRPLAALKVDGGPSGNAYLMQLLADLLQTEVRVAAAREATAMGIASLAGHAALGTSLEELAGRWQAEAVYRPRMAQAERDACLERWQRALSAVRGYHGGEGSQARRPLA